MFRAFKELKQHWSELKRFNLSAPDSRHIVFYSEGGHDWPHFKAMLLQLLDKAIVSYVSSEKNDPGYLLQHPHLRTYYIGTGSARTVFFQTLDASQLVMSLPELEKYSLKRSKNPVHYTYVFHSINSTHMVYREGSFDHYDSVLCVGPHHRAEIRAAEAIYNLKAKELVDHGSIRMDSILEKYTHTRESYEPSSGNSKNVILASSWGHGSIVEDGLSGPIVRELLDSGHQVTLRLHPMTVRRLPKLVATLRKEFIAEKKFILEDSVSSDESFSKADLMISDWSGAGTEFAFGLERPVIYVDTAPKLNNPNYLDLNISPLEMEIRHQIGRVVAPKFDGQLADVIEALTQNYEGMRQRIVSARSKWIYNVGTSAKVGADYILNKSNEISRKK